MEERCFYHNDKQAVINCFQCTKFICESCRRFSYGYIYCPSCFDTSKCKTGLQAIDEFEYKPYKHGTVKKIIRFLFKFSFRISLLAVVLYGFQNKDLVMKWIFKQGYTKILKNISPELANLVKDGKISSPVDIVKNPVANVQLQTFAKSMELYRTIYGEYPDDFEKFLKSNFETEAKGKDITLDTWSNHYKYINKGDNYELSSAGPDGTFGTNDDISNIK